MPEGPRRKNKRTPIGRFFANKAAVIGLAVLVLFMLAAVLAPVLAGHDPYKINTSLLRKPPSKQHWFGTDTIGRDQFARVLFGARISLSVGFAAMLTVTILGLIVGSLAGWIGGFTDFLLMRIIDVVLAFPYIVLALTIIAILGPSLVTIIVVFTIVGFGGTAKLLRAEILRLRNNDFIEAARASGVPSSRILVRHVLPNAVPIVLTLAVGAIGDGIVGEAALSFLGRGIQEPQAAWGLMIARSRGFFSDSPHLLMAPGLALVILILAVVFIGDGVRDALDPKVDSRFL
jgi:peptide/nickel transport system permease protein